MHLVEPSSITLQQETNMENFPENILTICLAEVHTWGFNLLTAEELLGLILKDDDLCEELIEYYEDAESTSSLLLYEVEELSTLLSQELIGEHIPAFHDGIAKNFDFYARLTAAAKARGWMA